MNLASTDLPMLLSGWAPFFVTLQPGFKPKENIQVLTHGQGIQGVHPFPTQNQTSYQKQHVYIFLLSLVYAFLIEMKRVNGKDVLFEKVCIVANLGAIQPAYSA